MHSFKNRRNPRSAQYHSVQNHSPSYLVSKNLYITVHKKFKFACGFLCVWNFLPHITELCAVDNIWTKAGLSDCTAKETAWGTLWFVLLAKYDLLKTMGGRCSKHWRADM